MRAEEAVLVGEALSIGYEGKKRGASTRVVAEGLDICLRSGKFVCLLGPNGVGKSTLLRSLAGMQEPLNGRIQLCGTDLEALTPKERARLVSVVLTDTSPSGMFDGYSVVALGRHPHTGWGGSLKARDRERIEWALQAVGAQDLARRQVSELSDGERQKVMIARALAQEAGLMLLDEPTAFLDLPRRVELMRTLGKLAREEGLAVLLSTHDLDLALRSADELWLLGTDGKLSVGMPEELALSGKIASVFSSREVDWDPSQGAFRMHRESCASIGLVGTGASEVWTRRALARIGYEVLDTEGSQGQIVEVRDADGGNEWILRGSGRESRFATLSELVEGLKHH